MTTYYVAKRVFYSLAAVEVLPGDVFQFDGLEVQIFRNETLVGQAFTTQQELDGTVHAGILTSTPTSVHNLLVGDTHSPRLLSGVGTVGQLLTSNGASADPSWQNGVLLKTTVQISSAQLLALGGTPILLIPAPGVGKVIIPIYALMQTFPGSNPYITSGNDAFQIQHRGTAAIFSALTTGVLTQGGGSITGVFMPNIVAPSMLSGPVTFPTSSSTNKDLVIWNTDAGPTNGNGSARVTVFYNVLDVT